jgi:hypothetical protein
VIGRQATGIETSAPGGTQAAAPLVAALLPVAIGVVALAARLRLAWADTQTIVGKAVADDGYYYFVIARNIAHGHNVTFDGETITNGFHPLWLALITPVFFVADGQTLPVHLILTIGSALGAITTVMIFLALRRLVSAPAAAIAAGVYALHPYAITDSVVGVETPLVVALFSAMLWLYVRMWQEGARRREDVAFGALCGLLMLARTDTIFIVPCVLGALLARTPAAERPARAIRFGAPAAAVLAPWLIWTLAATGTVVQVSGEAGSWPSRHAYLAAHGDGWWTQARHGLWLVREELFRFLPQQYIAPPGSHPLRLMAIGAVVLAAMCVAPPRGAAAATRSRLWIIAAPALGVLLALLYHAGVRWHWRTWYFAPAGVLFAIVLGIMLDHAAAWARGVARAVAGEQRRARAAALATLALYAAAIVLLAVQLRPDKPDRFLFDEGAQLNQLTTARWISANTPVNARVGSFNAGIIGYYSGRTVVNLDGVVNKDALRAFQTCTTGDYVREMRLDYVADFQIALAFTTCGEDVPGYETVATLGVRLPYFLGGFLDVRRVKP